MPTASGFTQDTPFLATALACLDVGISTVPPTEDGEKKPAFEWKLYQAHCPSRVQVLHWYSCGRTGVGIITGKVSGNLEVLDFDNREIYRAFLELAQVSGYGDLIDRLRAGYEEWTPEGVHIPYRCETSAGNQKLARRIKQDAQGQEIRDEHGNFVIETLIETRGEGGFVIIAPSNGKVHPSGKPYVLQQGGLATIRTISPEDREAVFTLCRAFNEIVEKSDVQPEQEQQPHTPRGDRPGDQFNTKASWEEVLEPQGWVKVYTRNDVTYWRRPGKDRGVSATTNYAGSDLLYVFSTSTPFEAERGCSKFSAYALLYHGGDFKKAAETLAKDGFGSSIGSSSRESAKNEPWPEPEPLPGGLLPVPEMNEKLIPLPFRPWLIDIAERIQCSLSFPTIGAIIAIAALVGRLIGIRPKKYDDWLVIPNLWGAVIGRPGILKTPALAEVMKPLRRLEIQALKNYEDDLKTWEKTKLAREAERAALKHQLTAAAKKGAPVAVESFTLPNPTEGEPVPVRYIVNDSTIEKLGVILNQNPRGVLLFRDELTGWLRTLDRDGHEGDRAFYLEAWNGTGSYTYDRIGRGTLHIKAACVSILGGIQPGPIADYLRAAAHGGGGDDGLMQRFQLLVYPDDPGSWRNVDRWPNTEAKNNAFELFKNLDTLNPHLIGAEKDVEENAFLRFTPHAQGLFDEWRTDLEHKIRSRDEHPVLEAHLSKYRSLMPSLALLFHLLEVVDGQAEGAVSERAAKMAAAWCDFLEAHARRIYQGITQYALFSARKLAERIKEGALPSPFTPRQVIHKGWAGLSTFDDIKQAAEILEDLHWLRSEKIEAGGKGGRPRFHYHMNPRLRREEATA